MHPHAFLDLDLKNKWFCIKGKEYFCIDYEIRKNNTILVRTDSRSFAWKYLSEYVDIKLINKPIPKKYQVKTKTTIPRLSKKESREYDLKERDRKTKENKILELTYGMCSVHKCKQTDRFVSGILHTTGAYEFGSFQAKTSAYRAYHYAKKIILENYDDHLHIMYQLGKLRVDMLNATELRLEITKPKPLGVDYMEKVHKWRANIRVDGKPIHISLEETEELGVASHAKYVKENNLELKSENSYVSKKFKIKC